jgi:tetratricopeptide (TPR) repeat protein
MEVKAWKEIVIIPTYGIGSPEKNPVFLEKRIYQGSSGSVYPYPVIEKILDEKTDKAWNALFLENRYLKIMILPELGGRIQMAYDKTKQRHFIYYNSVIKPALVGLTGPWISGGIEFNWPQHHRPSTYEPVDYSIEENADGSKTVWCSEVERMFHTRGMTGFTLYTDKAYLEIKVKLYNRTPHPQTFLWWANPAVKVNDEYQSVFPPDVHAVFDHGKRDVSKYPVATGTYYKVDYSAGMDISRYKSIPVPTSYMAIASNYNFVGGYENDTRGGLLHVANHHVSPGKKQWTWGCSDFGVAWDRNLTDSDGPYIELMCGVYTDNQPDFSWIMPYEEKSFCQYFMPYRDVGVVKNATKEALVNLEFVDGQALVKAYCTGEYTGARVILKNNNRLLFEETFNFTPKQSFEKTVRLEKSVISQEVTVSIVTREGKILVSWQPEKEEIKPIPNPAKPAKKPAEISSIEQLYLTGLHLEQYRHATFDPADYYHEALKREPGDVRNNNAMGLWLMRRGQFAKAESHFRAAIATLTEHNPNPYDGEPLFNLGLCLRFQYRYKDARDAFYKSVWNAAWQDAGYFNLAQLAAREEDWEEALDLVSRSLIHNWHNHKARHLKTAILRRLNRKEEALKLVEDSIALDGFNFGILYEKHLITGKTSYLSEIKELIRDYVHNYIEFSLDYAAAGMLTEAKSLLETSLINSPETYPMVYYFMGWFAWQSGDSSAATHYFILAEKQNPAYCFPNRLEEILALQCAIKLNPNGSKAPYYLGNFWYAGRQYDEAIECWRISVSLNKDFPTVHRNLAQAYFNKLKDPALAAEELEKAFALDTTDARILMELDQLYKKLGKPFNDRLVLLEEHADAVDYRDDLYLERATLYNLVGNHEKALDLLMKRKFHPWEGGEGKVTGQYMFAHIELAKNAIRQQDYKLALNHLKATLNYPHNLGEGKLYGAQENDIFYWMGCAYEGLEETENANTCWVKASMGLSEPTAALFYNDQQPDKIFYQGLALIKLGQNSEASSRFNKLKDFGEKYLFDKVSIDYFAVSLPDLLIWDDDLQKRNTQHCNYLIGLGYFGQGQKKKAVEFFKIVLNADRYHAGSLVHLAMCS